MFGLDDIFNLFSSSSPSSTPSVLPRHMPGERETRRSVERVAKEICPPVGDVIEVYNNIQDTHDNFLETAEGKHRTIPIISKLFPGVKPSKGDHIMVQRTLYAHHGIYENVNRVYQYDKGAGVNVVSLEDFADGDKVIVYSEGSHYSPDQIIKRAKSRVGEDKYNILWNNCQNLATWCRLGSKL